VSIHKDSCNIKRLCLKPQPVKPTVGQKKCPSQSHQIEKGKYRTAHDQSSSLS